MEDMIEKLVPLFLLLVFAPVIVQTIDVSFGENHLFYVGDTPIKSLNDGSRISGRFALGSGYIRETPQFVYYSQEGKGYKLRTVPAENTIIFEDNETPYLSTFEVRREGIIFHGWYPVGNKYEFHVPNGTIIQDYVLDSELR